MGILDVLMEMNITPKRISRLHKKEFASACPNCGGKDRFIIWTESQSRNCTGRYWCRQCSISGDAIQFCKEFLGLNFKDAIEKLKENFYSDGQFFDCKARFPIKKNRSKEWREVLGEILKEGEKNISQHPPSLSFLKKRGIGLSEIALGRLGYLSKNLNLELDNNNIFLFKGILIPNYKSHHSNCLESIKIRSLERNIKYCMVKGSSMNVQKYNYSAENLDNPSFLLIVVESELDALAICSQCSDFAIVVGTRGVFTDFTHTDIFFEAALRKKHEQNSLILCHDNDDAGNNMAFELRERFHNTIVTSVPTNLGKDIGEAVAKGWQIRPFFQKFIGIGAL